MKPYTDNPPLVSCIMPTYNHRVFVPQAIYYFLRPDYPNKELIIVDDGTDEVGDLVSSDERIRYIRSPGRQSIGIKRNLACEEARGPIIAHWDASQRLRYQVEALLRVGADACGIATVLFYELLTGATWKYTFPIQRRPWQYGSTLFYTRMPLHLGTVPTTFVAFVVTSKLGCIGSPQCYHQEVSQEEPGLIVAAVFGFTANLFGVPQKQLQQYKTDLKSAATYPRS